MHAEQPAVWVRVRPRGGAKDSTAGSAAGRRVAYLDGIRGIAVLLVLLYHAWAFHLLSLRVSGGYIGVDLFFVLSGYVITSLLQNKRTGTVGRRYLGFIRARFHRLYPALLAMLGSVLIVVWAGWHPDAQQTPGEVTRWAGIAAVQLSSPFLAADWREPHLVGPTWTLSVEWIFYAVWPFALWQLLRSRKPWQLVGACALVTYSLSLLLPADVWWVLPPGRIAQILAGATFAVWLARPERAVTTTARSRSAAPTVLAILALIIVLTWSFRVSVGPAYYGYRQVGAPLMTACAVTLLWGGVRSQPFAQLLGWRPLAAVGRASYSLYLVQYPWMFALGGSSGPTRSWSTCTLAMAGVAASAYVSYRFFERPYLRRSSKAKVLPTAASQA
jgi:peptidoglycan/LPS O-acetylase OafA/YrhL